MAAAANDHKEVLELLIQNGASLDMKTEADFSCINTQGCSDMLAHEVK